MSEFRGDTCHTSAPECPHCRYVFRDAWEWGNGGEGVGEHECDCGTIFQWERHVSVTYSTKPESPNKPSRSL